MRNSVFKWCSGWAILITIIALLPSSSLADSTTISFSPSTATAHVGEMVNIDLRIANVNDLYGAQVQVAFDPARLQVLDDDPVQPGVQILPGSMFPKSDPSYVVQNTVDNIAGTIQFAITLLAPEAPLSGSGTLATVRFAAKTEGTAQLSWPATILANPNGQAISHSTANGQIQISPLAPPPSGKDCSDLIGNGSCEASTYWTMPVTPHKADYTTVDKHGGSRSIRLGVEPGSADVYSHSSAYQKIHVPANATSVTLSFWAKRGTQDPIKGSPDPAADLYDPASVIDETFDWNAKSTRAQYDWQEVLILQGGCYNWLATLMRERSNDGVWAQYTYDLTAFAGQDIVVYFNAINNGDGRRTWMYVDDIQVLACFGGSACSELVRNRSFEWTADWERAPTPRSANYTTDAKHTGARSMRLGIVPPTADTYSHSSAYQRISIPAGASNPTLSFWYKAHTEDTTRSDWKGYDWSGYDPAAVIAGAKGDERCCGEIDWQEMLILDTNYRLVSNGVVLRQNQNDGVWKQKTFDLSPYKGMTIVLYFNVINDGNGRRTWMYVDDVSVNLCGQQARFDPSPKQVGAGESFTINMRLENIADLYGFETTIRFDPNILEVQDADAGTAGVQVSKGAWLPASTHIVVNSADNASGLITFAATLVSPEPALNGSGNVVSIPFRAKAAGTTPVAFNSLKVVNSSAVVVPVKRTDGQVTVTSNQATLAGKVQLEGRTNHSGVTILLDSCCTFTSVADGSYSCSTTGGSHKLTFSHPGYLTKVVTVNAVAGSTVTVPQVTLLGGDINGDGVIDILDLVAVASQFGSSSPTPAAADINADGQVDIIDIVLVAKNFS
jgi:hypothetical protein